MDGTHENKTGPLVSVLVPTFNRPQYLSMAIASILRQSYRNLEIIVVNDGGEDVTDLVKSFDDSRIIFINRKQNHGKAYSLNEALRRAEGKYIAYLDDDDVYYPNHIELLVETLEGQTDCQVAYSDLYKDFCMVLPDGTRQILSKVVEVSRDFDRFLMLYFNHVLHVCLMHRRDLIEKTGLYNENLSVLIDWDMTRRLAFFSDFYHVSQITGEYYHTMGQSDRISVLRRKDKKQYLKNFLTIRTTRPAKPWPKIDDLSIILLTDQIDKKLGQVISSIWRHTFYPYKLYLPIPRACFEKISTDMPDLVLVPIDPLYSEEQKLDSVVNIAEGEYIAVVPGELPINDHWVENPLYALINQPKAERMGFLLEGSSEEYWGVVVRKKDLQDTRRNFPDMPLKQSLGASGIVIRKPDFSELPFQFDSMLKEARLAEEEGNYAQAARMFECIAQHHQNGLWMKTLAAGAFFKTGDYKRAFELCYEVNQRRPTVETLLLEAKISRQNGNYNPAIESLKKAEQILSGEIDCLFRTEAGV